LPSCGDLTAPHNEVFLAQESPPQLVVELFNGLPVYFRIISQWIRHDEFSKRKLSLPMLRGRFPQSLRYHKLQKPVLRNEA
jgi:hypothetical protein